MDHNLREVWISAKSDLECDNEVDDLLKFETVW